MSIVRRAVVGAVVLGAGLASTAGIASAAPSVPSVPGVDAAITAADAAAQAGTQAGLSGAQAGLDAANAAATAARTVAGVDLPGLDQLPTSALDLPGLTQGLGALPSASDFTDLPSLPTDPAAFGDLLTAGLPTGADLTPDLSALDALPGA